MDKTTPLLCYDPDPAYLTDLDAVRCWLSWLQHPECGAMALDLALPAHEYVRYETGERALIGNEARGFDRARKVALRIIESEGLDPDAELLLARPIE